MMMDSIDSTATRSDMPNNNREYQTTVLLATNIHCTSCVSAVREILRSLFPDIKDVQASILTQEVRVRHKANAVSTVSLVRTLVGAGYEVEFARTYDAKGSLLAEVDVEGGKNRYAAVGLKLDGWLIQRKHVDFCKVCRDESSIRTLSNQNVSAGMLSSWGAVAKHARELHRNVSPADRAERTVASKPLRRSPPAATLTAGRDKVITVKCYKKKRVGSPADDRQGSVERKDSRRRPAGRDDEESAELKELMLAPTSNSSPAAESQQMFEARIAISGMTCAACANTITDSVQRLEFVDSIIVTLLTNSATLRFYGPRSNIALVIKEIEDTGYDAVLDTLTEMPPTAKEYTIDMEKRPPDNVAIFSVGGMTCASCADSVTRQVRQLDGVKDVQVSLMTNSARVVFSGDKLSAEKIKDEIEDIGFDASVQEVRTVSSSQSDEFIPERYVAKLSIGGMTCGSCASSITHGLEELPFATAVHVDLVSNSATVTFAGKENLKKIVEAVEDLGFEASVASCEPVVPEGSSQADPSTREVMIRIDGMYCRDCPEKVMVALEALDVSQASLDIRQTPSLKDPILKVSYQPRPPTLTIRSILATINSIHPQFKASVYHPPSIEDRSRAMQLHERRRLLSRLGFVFIMAIPTFVIGIVFMSLVPSSNRVRIYLEQPTWSGTVSRMDWALFIITTPVMVYGADIFHVRAFKEIRSLWRPGSKIPILRRFYRFGSMNLLISAATLVSYISSLAMIIVGATRSDMMMGHTPTYFDSVVFLTLFILAGRSLEAYSKARAGDAVAALGKLRPSEALLVTQPSEHEKSYFPESSRSQIQRVSVDELEIGDIVNVPHGASPPADGTVVDEGRYQFDESSLTGESRPVSKSAGDVVYSGSVNIGQQVSIRITELGGTSMLDKIVAVVREGQSKRAPMERVADAIVAYFVPAVTFIALFTFILWFALGQSGALPPHYLDNPLGGWAFWSLQFAIAVFVVACPCGLALAAPTALFVGVGVAAKKGILVRGGGEAFQEATRLDAMVFDKTGTLTEGGSLRVSEHEFLTKDEELTSVAWTLAHHLEERSTHPIAKAIHEYTQPHATMQVVSSDVTEIPGQGLKGTITLATSPTSSSSPSETLTYEAAIGNERLARSLTSSKSASSREYFLSALLSRYQSAAKSTAVLLLRPLSDEQSEFHPVLIFATSDPIRRESRHVVASLQQSGIDVYMCTGDNEKTARAVAASLGIPASNVMANVLPHQKAEFIRSVQNSSFSREKRRKIVAFAGDGTNDSPALSIADLSIALSSGSDIAINASSFILLSSNLSSILDLLAVSRRVITRVKLNFLWAAVYNIILVPVAAGVFYPLPRTKIVHEEVVVGHWRLDPVWAALAMALSSVSVVLSSLVLRFELRATMLRWTRWLR